MSDIPFPPPGPGTFDEEEIAHEKAAYEAQLNFAWHDALEWARDKGDRKPLARLLRGDATKGRLELQDIYELRDFFADVLEGKAKRSRGGQPKRPERMWGTDASGFPTMVDVHSNRTLEIREWVKANKDVLGRNVKQKAADHFNVVLDTIENAVRREAPTRKTIRSK